MNEFKWTDVIAIAILFLCICIGLTTCDHYSAQDKLIEAQTEQIKQQLKQLK